MPVWKSFANRRDSSTFFAVEQGKTRETVAWYAKVRVT